MSLLEVLNQRAFVFAAALLGSLVLVIAAVAHPLTPSQPYRGTIESIDRDTMVVQLESGEMTFRVAPEAMIQLDGRLAMMQDLEAGQSVVLSAERLDDDIMIVMSVEASSRTTAEILRGAEMQTE